ncbi:MAG: DUF4868 domain-containing protein [Fluviicoccus sp.]|uniref:Kiwa anti-phage protein KwaB-like domain-containing protein n=1 Tax=Fluviicoccus sp. TaxID=2003552 RepID=UPI0027235856|nr:Kiwa anti-phage protein KwaB-like domain-containing protein [Fluviicoccus sp.]MDO8330312.1 DUF4868 domain-containing protein [Fluviicoccus sp.]
MNFDLQNVMLVSLYGYFEDERGQNSRHVQIPIDPQLQAELKLMFMETNRRLGLPASEADMPIFDPAEKYASEEKIKIALETDYLNDLAGVVALRNLPSDVNALSQISELVYYYAVFVDDQNRNIYAFKRASQFKGVVKSKLAWINGELLSLMTASVFKLDKDFDYLVSDTMVYILRPNGFESTTSVHGQILAASTANAQAIADEIDFLDVSNITTYAQTHARSARLLAAIRSRNDLAQIDRDLLLRACEINQVDMLDVGDGKFSPNTGHEYDFLCVLDRRAYTTILIPDQSERYVAASRTKR